VVSKQNRSRAMQRGLAAAGACGVVARNGTQGADGTGRKPIPGRKSSKLPFFLKKSAPTMNAYGKPSTTRVSTALARASPRNSTGRATDPRMRIGGVSLSCGLAASKAPALLVSRRRRKSRLSGRQNSREM